MLVSAAWMQAADRHTIEQLGVPVLTLMERAGEGLARATDSHVDLHRGDPILLVCGKGNNGGDGMVAARHFKALGGKVEVLLMGRARELQGAARTNWARLLKAKIARHEVADEAALARHAHRFERAALVVDALLGTGARGPLTGVVAAACAALTESGAPCVAADLPTGVDATTGEAQAGAVRADLTVTFAYPKFGHMLQPGRSHCGALEVVDIGIPVSALPEEARRFEVLTPLSAAALFPRRAPTAHKGDVGRVRIVGGSPGMLGAPALAARAALRSGCGLATVCVPAGLYDALAPLLLEATASLWSETPGRAHTAASLADHAEELRGCDSLAVGPGLGRDPDAWELARGLVAASAAPVVLDADGLNAFEGRAQDLARRAAPLVLTPHVGELARLTKLAREEVERRRLELPSECAREWNAVVLLKGAPTVVAAPDGRVRVNPTGNAGMATGGSGDTLTGIVATLLARGLDPFDAASLGAYIHGYAGDLAADELGQESLVASDLVTFLPDAIQSLLSADAPSAARR